MALLFVDSGGDYYTAAQANRKWTTTASASLSSAGGRRGTNGWNTGGNGSSYTFAQGAKTTLIVGCSIKPSAAAAGGTPILIQALDGASEQWSVRSVVGTGLFTFTRNGTVLGTSVAAPSFGAESYLEVKCTIDDSAGVYEVRLNGIAIIGPTSSADTKNTANTTADRIVFGSYTQSGAVTCVIDDIYICDSSGATNNSFLGDVRVDAVLPAGAGANTGMTPSASTNVSCVDENPANDDTDYVSSSVVSTKDTYDFTNISHTPASIFGIQINMIARKDDAGTRSIAAVTRSGGADTDGATQALSTSYLNYREIRETDPNTSAAWTKTNLNAAEFGAKVAA